MIKKGIDMFGFYLPHFKNFIYSPLYTCHTDESSIFSIFVSFFDLLTEIQIKSRKFQLAMATDSDNSNELFIIMTNA